VAVAGSVREVELGLLVLLLLILLELLGKGCQIGECLGGLNTFPGGDEAGIPAFLFGLFGRRHSVVFSLRVTIKDLLNTLFFNFLRALYIAHMWEIITLVVIILVLLGLVLYFALRPRTYVVSQNCPYRADDKGRFIEFSKSPCFGKCPVYDAVIYNDGTVDFNGKNNVSFIGNKRVYLSHFEMWYLTEQLANLNFFCLKDKYDGPVTDLPTTVVTVYKAADNRKTVVARYGIPTKLVQFIVALHELLMKHVSAPITTY
jgi:hypothetical protein